MKRLLAGMARRLGYDIVPHWRVAATPLVQRLHEIFARHAIDLVIDVGANQAQYYRMLRDDLGFTGRIVSFEPVPELAAALQAQSKHDPDWTVHACALGRATGELPLNVTALTEFSSFLPPLDEDPSGGGNIVMRQASVPVRTLDAMFPDAAALRHAYLKLDTQGFDLEVAAGAARALAVIPALQTEVSFQPIYADMPDYRAAIDLFAQHGFRVGDFFLVSTDADGVAYEFDCVMLRSTRT